MFSRWPGGPLKNHTGASPQGKGVSNDAESTNWSGYAVTGGTDAFNSVSASWTEPTATCDDSGTEYSSFWVGLDGYNSSSVEQTGTDADCDGGSPDYYGWYEMYPADPVYYSNTVKPGDGDEWLRLNGAGENLTWAAADFEDFAQPRPEIPASAAADHRTLK